MKKLSSLILFLFLSIHIIAQLNGSGYYFVRNLDTHHYTHIINNKSSGITGNSADFSDLRMFADEYMSIHSTPSCVLYIKVNQSGNPSIGDIQAQGTGVYSMVGIYPSIREVATGIYQTYATKAGTQFYVAEANDANLSTLAGLVRADSGNDYINFNILPISSDGDNYVGVKPDITCDKYYKQYYVSYPFSFANNVNKAYIITKVDSELGVVVKKEITGVIPAYTPIIMEVNSAEVTDNRLNLGGTSTADVSGNILSGTLFNWKNGSKSSQVHYDEKTMRRLGVMDNGKLGYIVDVPNNAIVNNQNGCIPANESYLVVPEGTPEQLQIVTEDEYEEMKESAGIGTASIDSATPTAIYSVAGERQNTYVNGINIVRTISGRTKKILK